MNDAIKIEVRGGIKTADSRVIHKYLGARTRHNDWITRKIAELDFVEGKDYYSELSNRSDGKAGKKATVYYLTQRAAEHLGMAESGEKGKEIRDAFIAARDELKRRVKSEIAAKSTAVRKALTPRYAAHGIGHRDYGRVTVKEYEVAFGDKTIRKPDMNESQILALTALESIECLYLDSNPAIQGTRDIEGSLEDSGRALEGVFRRLRITGHNVREVSA